jgi:hypothetical protein
MKPLHHQLFNLSDDETEIIVAPADLDKTLAALKAKGREVIAVTAAPQGHEIKIGAREFDPKNPLEMSHHNQRTKTFYN